MSRLDERGAISTEYGLLIALIAATIVVAVAIFGGFVGGMFQESCNKMLADGVAVAVPAADCT